MELPLHAQTYRSVRLKQQYLLPGQEHPLQKSEQLLRHEPPPQEPLQDRQVTGSADRLAGFHSRISGSGITSITICPRHWGDATHQQESQQQTNT